MPLSVNTSMTATCRYLNTTALYDSFPVLRSVGPCARSSGGKTNHLMLSHWKGVDVNHTSVPTAKIRRQRGGGFNTHVQRLERGRSQLSRGRTGFAGRRCKAHTH